MKTIFFKELTETTIRVLGLLIILGPAVVGLAVFPTLTVPTGTIVGPEIFLVGAFGFSIAAFLIGAIQISQDWSLDRWSFLTHRPISRSRIFAAKVLAGLCFYFLAAGVPLLVAIIYVISPGPGRGPFVWKMILPGIALWFNGLLWYFAAIIVATREARWYGSRLLPLGAALVLSLIAIVGTLNFVEVFLVIAIGLLILIPPAYGGFIAGGILHRQPAPSRLLHIATVATGALLLVGLCGASITAALQSIWQSGDGPISSQSYQVDSDGRILLYTSGLAGNAVPVVFEGDPLPADSHPMDERYYLGDHNFLNLNDLRDRNKGRHAQMPQWSADSYVRRLTGSRDVWWFYIPSERRIKAVNLRAGATVGSIGPSGFVNPPAIAEPFSSDLIVQRFPIAWDDSRVYEIDTETFALKVLADVGPEERVVDATLVSPLYCAFGEEPEAAGLFASPVTRPSSQKPTLFVATKSTVRAFRDGGQILNVPLLARTGDYWRDYWGFSITPTRKGSFILHYQQSWVYGPPPPVIVEIGADGQIIRQRELPLLKFEGNNPPQWIGFIQGLFMPLAFIWLTFIRWMASTTRLGVATPGAWMYPVCALILTLATLGTVLLLRRRFQLSRIATLGWGLLTLLLGLAGVLTMLLIRGLPLRIKCPSCGKPRAINRDTCEHCGASHAPPQLTGIEIFE